MSFIDWREGVERWARLVGGDMTKLSPKEIADAAPHFLGEDILGAMRAEGHLELCWETLLDYLRGHLGLSLVALQAALHQEEQEDSESVATYATRFDLLRREM